MKTPALVVCLIFGSAILNGQTDSIEKAVIFQKVQSKEIGTEDFGSIGVKWNQTIKKFGQYPDLPLDQAGTVHYSFIEEFTGIKKEKLFSHIHEWLSIYHGIFPANLYSNIEDGRIVLTNSANLKSSINISYTCVISIKSEKVLIEFFNIGYVRYYDGYATTDGFWIPERTVNFSINQVYPVILQKPADWNSDLYLLKETNEFFKSDADNLSHYIKNYDSYNNF
jgi:hypothetical protein